MFASIAREIALDINPIEIILKTHGITDKQFQTIQKRKDFQVLVAEQLQLWQSSLSVAERVKLKSQHLVEQSLEQMFKLLHDPKFSDTAKVELLKALQRGGGIGVVTNDKPTGEKISIIIDLGADKQLKFEKQLPAPVTIDGELA